MRLFNSLFWQLYLSILAALVLIILLFVGLVAYQNRQSDVEYFSRDIQFVSKQIIANWTKSPEHNAQLIRELSDETMFHIFVEDEVSLKGRLRDYELNTRQHTIAVYQHLETRLFLSVQKLLKTANFLVISDIDIEPAVEAENISEHIRQNIEHEIREESQTKLILQVTGIGLMLLIGLTLMVLVRRISVRIEGLSAVSNSWANGQLSVRAETNAPAPLNELAMSLNKMAADLSQTLSEQQVMTHAISHELRTPLSKIQLALSLLTRKYEQLQNEPLSHDLERYIDELEYLVNQILTFAKFNHRQKPHSTTEIDLTKLIADRVKELNLLNKTVEIELLSEAIVKIEADPFNLQIMIDNVLKNALKYATQHIKVRLNYSSDINQPEAQKVSILIEDDGPGIPAADRESILMPFARIDESRNRDSGGFGLGLAIVDAIVRQQKGAIQLGESALGGLSIAITLPSGFPRYG